MKFIIPSELLKQMNADGIDFIHVRDFISVDIEKDGSYTTDFDITEKCVLKDEYINNINKGLAGWFRDLESDSDFYRNVEDNCINVHGEELEAHI